METLNWALPHFVLVGLFVLMIIAIALDRYYAADKAAVTLVVGAVSWGIVTLWIGGDYEHQFLEMGAEIVAIFMFLFAAMTLVEILSAHGFFDAIRFALARRRLSEKKQFAAIMVMTFWLSAALDNLTITIVMVTLALRFFQGRNRLIASAGIVIIANAGGAWSPIGDVTTIMIWLEGKFSAWQVISQGLFPSLVMGAVATVLLMWKLTPDSPDTDEPYTPLVRRQKLVNGVVLSCFALPFVAHMVHLPPYLGLLFGLGVVWLLVHHLEAKAKRNGDTQLGVDLEEQFKEVNYPTLLFLAGILAAVSALGAAGILQQAVSLLEGRSFLETVCWVTVLGVASAVVDNVPLTAIALDVIQITDPGIWVLLALAVGTGGSLTVFGSAAGVVAMNKTEGLDFGTYFRLAFPAVAISYIVGMAAWYGQYLLIQAI
jgi:Na+/H+ antiporter NhaD/arsenite permease-like protein